MTSSDQPALHSHSPASGGDTEASPTSDAEVAVDMPSPEIHVPYQLLDYEETDLGMIVGRYSVIDPEQGPIARGGEASVYKGSVDASAVGATTYVAVKVVERFIADERKFDDNSKELTIHSLFGGDDAHPHIVGFLFGNEGHLVYQESMEKWKCTRVIVTEWMAGRTLEHALSELRAAGCTEAEALCILSQVAQGIARLQSLGIFHRDLKPLNVLLSQPVTSLLETELKIADFGLSGFFRNWHDRTMSMGGSGRYAPPENWSRALRIANGACNDRFDVYSLGMIIVRALFGRIPDMRADAVPPFWDSLREKVSRRGVDLLKRMLDENHTTRINIQGVLDHPWLRSSHTYTAGLSTASVGAVETQQAKRKGRKRMATNVEGGRSKKSRIE